MENSKFWKIAVIVCGASGVGAFVFWSLYNRWLSLPIFDRLNSTQTFVIMIIFLVLVFLALIVIVVFGHKPRSTNADDKVPRLTYFIFGSNLTKACFGTYLGIPSGISTKEEIENIKIMLMGNMEELKIPEPLKMKTVDFINGKGKKEELADVRNLITMQLAIQYNEQISRIFYLGVVTFTVVWISTIAAGSGSHEWAIEYSSPIVALMKEIIQYCKFLHLDSSAVDRLMKDLQNSPTPKKYEMVRNTLLDISSDWVRRI